MEAEEVGYVGWYDDAVDMIVAIYISHPDHDRQDPDIVEQLKEIGDVLDSRGGFNLMRAAHAEFARRCTAQNLRDSRGYMSAPRSLEYRWGGIGDWQS